MHRRWRTLRQRTRRARSGQVSAVATVLALLLFVLFLTTFVIGALALQMSQLEYQHELQVENQLLRLQTSVLTAAEVDIGPATLSTPVTLGSQGEPPFGAPSSGFLQTEASFTAVSAGLGLANVTPAPPTWNTGSGCFASGGNGTCSGNNGPILYWNFSGSHDTVTPGVNGCGSSGCNIIYNLSGNFDNISLSVKGNNVGNIEFVIFGNNDNYMISYAGSCNNHRNINSLIVGTNDTYAVSFSGCASGVGATLNTLFLGSKGFICPYGNGVQTDLFLGVNWDSANGVTQNITWQNAIGRVTAQHTIPQNGGADSLSFANTTGYSQCPFTKATNSGPYKLAFLSGIRAHLNNRYLAPADVAYDQGAVILGVQNGGSVMVNPPQFSYQIQPFGVSAELTLVNIIGATGTDTGYGTSAVLSSVVSQQTFQVLNGQNGNEFLTFLELNITTAYPQAWATFWNAQAAVIPFGTTCVPGAGVPAGHCLTPPAGRSSTIEVPLFVGEFTLRTITAQVSIY